MAAANGATGSETRVWDYRASCHAVGSPIAVRQTPSIIANTSVTLSTSVKKVTSSPAYVGIGTARIAFVPTQPGRARQHPPGSEEPFGQHGLITRQRAAPSARRIAVALARRRCARTAWSCCPHERGTRSVSARSNARAAISDR